ncbi:bacterial regulatory helix-turn-helix, lysR family protein [Collimonas arenae]|uniref:Bacterial regulatory helix-turn-helix, lysR family protein n=1 Tax=Collimonas arenae TaxID=279058 RepID=A0A127QJI1_9BURK|nr:bacterial regulatory helix-turn-helix, lysR family protein [Collimonas arenae]
MQALRAFEVAARFENFSAAAEELHVTHGAVSRQIAALEAWLGMPVFHRIGKRVQLTDDGRRYLITVQAAFNNIAVATKQLRESGTVRVLHINALSTFAMRWLLPRLSGFQRLYPGVELKLSTSTSDKPLGEPGEMFDVAIRRGPGHWPNCESGEFLEESELPVCSPALEARSPIRQASDLAQHTLLHSDTRPDAWSKWLMSADVAPASCKKRQSFDHFYLALQAAIDGLGVALGPLPLITDELASGRLVTPIAEPVIRARSYWWIVARHQAEVPLIRHFCEWLQQEAKR